MNNNNYVLPFILNNNLANGRIVKLTDQITEILNQHKYTDEIANILAEFLIITCLLGYNLKSDGTVTCQYRSDESDIKLVVAQYRNNGEIRGYAEYNDMFSSFSNGNLFKGTLLVDVENSGQKYQGLIHVEDGCSISDAFSTYFMNSEQINTYIKTSVVKTSIFDSPKWVASGIIVRQMPFEDSEEYNFQEFERIKKYIQTIKDEEFMNLEVEDLLYSLFHEDGVSLFDKGDIIFKCTCSRENVESFIKNLSEKELNEIRNEGIIAIKCQFCSKDHVFE